MALTEDEREILGRLDERTINIYNLTAKQEDHLSKINDALNKHNSQIASNKTNIKWIIRVLGAVGILSGGSYGISQWLGG